ncbi:SMUG2 DNA glycosylase family protein [soil metagenome]
MTFADKILQFNSELHLDPAILPDGIGVMNPFKGENAETVWDISTQFYRKFYNDGKPRRWILGINPGRHGAGVTGIPFTDTKRLNEECAIPFSRFNTYEPSSVFVYEVIKAFGGAERFYGEFFINSICPLGFVKLNDAGKWVNYNYYDRKDLQQAVEPFILNTLQKQIALGLDTETVYCMGSGKNVNFLTKLNEKHRLFGRIIALDHPRFVVQYKQKHMAEYVQRYLDALNNP